MRKLRQAHMLTPRYKTKANLRRVQSTLCLTPSPFLQFLDPIYPSSHYCKFILPQPSCTLTLVQSANSMQALLDEALRRATRTTRGPQRPPTHPCTTPPPNSNTHSIRLQISHIQSETLPILRPTHTHANIPVPSSFYNCHHYGQDAADVVPCSGVMECCLNGKAVSTAFFHLRHCTRTRVSSQTPIPSQSVPRMPHGHQFNEN